MSSEYDTIATYELGKLQSLLTDDLIEICINPDGSVWYENQGFDFMKQSEEIKFSNEDTKTLCVALAGEAEIDLSDRHPVCSTTFHHQGWLIRAQILVAPVIREGSSVSLRFFKAKSTTFEPAYLSGGPIDASKEREEIAKKIADLAITDLPEALRLSITQKLNIVISGGTSSGKTSQARWLIEQVDLKERILTIEDAPDLMPQHPNKVMMVSKRNDATRNPDTLLQSSLRMRPDRIILSEVTGSDAYTFLKAINTGHGGSMTTIHADTAELAIERMAQTALEAGGQMTYQDMIAYVVRSLDVIIHVGKRDGKRGIMQVFLPKDYKQ